MEIMRCHAAKENMPASMLHLSQRVFPGGGIQKDGERTCSSHMGMRKTVTSVGGYDRREGHLEYGA